MTRQDINYSQRQVAFFEGSLMRLFSDPETDYAKDSKEELKAFFKTFNGWDVSPRSILSNGADD